MRAVRVDSDNSLRVRVHLADFRDINRAGCAQFDFDQTEIRARVNHAGIDRESTRVYLLRARRNCDARADRSDATAAYHNRAVLDLRAAHGHDARVAYRVSDLRCVATCVLLRARIADLLRMGVALKSEQRDAHQEQASDGD